MDYGSKVAMVDRPVPQVDRALNELLNLVQILEKQSMEFTTITLRVRDAPMTKELRNGKELEGLPSGLINKIEYLGMKLQQVSSTNSDTINYLNELI